MIVVFDLDGTLADSAPGILGALRGALAEHGVAPLPAETERALLGPPLYESLPPIVGEDRLWPVIESYRRRYATTMFESAAYPGVPQLLDGLRARGHTLAVATSKPEHFAVPILERNGLAGRFATIGGDELDGSLRTKALVLDKVLGRLGRPDPATVLMVGDRRQDVRGAREHRIRCVGVRWGYGTPGELEAEHPAALCDTPAEVAEFVAHTVATAADSRV